MKDDAYVDVLRRTIIGDAQPENVILLEIEPEKQKTRIDFAATETLLGIRSVCLTKTRETRPATVLRSRRARDADRAHL